MNSFDVFFIKDFTVILMMIMTISMMIMIIL